MLSSLKIPTNATKPNRRLSSKRNGASKRIVWTATESDWATVNAIQSGFYERMLGQPVAKSLVMRRALVHLATAILKSANDPKAMRAEARALLYVRGR